MIIERVVKAKKFNSSIKENLLRKRSIEELELENEHSESDDEHTKLIGTRRIRSKEYCLNENELMGDERSLEEEEKNIFERKKIEIGVELNKSENNGLGKEHIWDMSNKIIKNEHQMKDANDNDGQKRVSITNECGNIVNRIEQDLIKFENDNKNDNYEQIKIRNHSINNNSELTKEKDLIAQTEQPLINICPPWFQHQKSQKEDDNLPKPGFQKINEFVSNRLQLRRSELSKRSQPKNIDFNEMESNKNYKIKKSSCFDVSQYDSNKTFEQNFMTLIVSEAENKNEGLFLKEIR